MQVICSSFREHYCGFSNGWMVVVTNQAPPSHCGTHANRHLAAPDELHKIKIKKQIFNNYKYFSIISFNKFLIISLSKYK
jgi:hypothetical protein